MKLSKIKKNPNNPRLIRDEKFERLKRSLKEFPQMMNLRPIVIDEAGVILGGNMRFEALKANGLKEIPDEWVKRAEELTDDEKARFVITDNSSFGEYDWELIANEWTDYPLEDWGLDVPGFDLTLADADDEESGDAGNNQTLADKFLVPPFSVLDARQGYWQERKRAWIEIGIESELGRGESCLGFSEAAERFGYNKNGLLGFSEQARGHYRAGKGLARSNGQDLMRGEHTLGAIPPNERDRMSRSGKYATGAKETATSYSSQSRLTALQKTGDSSAEIDGTQTGTSIFDPVLCELVYRWFSGDGFSVLDPFAGGSVRGIVAARLNRNYVGIELRKEQIAANKDQAERLCKEGARPVWIEGDSMNAQAIAPGEYDLLFSCPPYADLEVYSDNPADLSTMPYDRFIDAYRQIIAAGAAMLRDDRFACFVVGEVRDKKGYYRNFVADTVQAFTDAGLKYYNEAILVTSIGSLPIRAGRQFEAGRKIGKTHQNVLVFVKGNSKRATEACGKVEIASALLPDGLVGN